MSSGESSAATCYRNGVAPRKQGDQDPGPQGPKDGGLDALGADVVLRAITNDGAFRVMVARTTGMVREAVQRQVSQWGDGDRMPRGRRLSPWQT